MPSQQEAKLLTISRNQAVIDVARWIWLSSEKLFSYTHIVANSALYEYTYTYAQTNWDDLAGKMLAEA